MSPGEHFNEAQRRRLFSSSTYIDKLLVDIEQTLLSASAESFPKYKNPLSPVQVRVVRDYLKRMRQQILRVLSNLEIPLPAATIDATHSIRVVLQFVEIALEEMAPDKLQGFGSVPPSLAPQLAGGLQEIKGIVRQIDSYLVQSAGADLSSRILQLTDTGENTRLLQLLAQIIERRRLIEFRAPLSQLVEKMESPAYEMAFFGRVSAGKSSLLNQIIGRDLLPTGVTPVTAVPTRIKNGRNSLLSVWTAGGGVRQENIDRLADFVTEAKNPGNEKHVTRLLVEVPIALLPEEAVLVDTPGLGSLALEGATETLAYLPRCDLGVVLIDASSSLHPDDLATLDALRSASIEPLAVLSKIDLVGEADRDHLIAYTKKQIRQQLGVEMEIAALSSHPAFRPFLQEWVHAQMEPRAAQARQLALASNGRKARRLCSRILQALDAIAGRPQGRNAPEAELRRREAEEQLRTVASRVERTQEECFRTTDRVRDLAEPALAVLTEKALAFWEHDGHSSGQNQQWIEQAVNQWAQSEAESVAHRVQSLARDLTDALHRAADFLFAGDQEEGAHLDRIVTEMPVPGFTLRTAATLKRPALLSLSRTLGRRTVLHDLAESILGSLDEFFSSYGRELEFWVRKTVDHLAKEFEIHADLYRAQLQRLAPEAKGSAEISGSEEAARDARDLRQFLEGGEQEAAMAVSFQE
jgi:GTP-binding protein EngB required for normal cell division